MPGTMFITPTELASLPVTGTPWSRVATVAAADAGTPNLANLDSIVQSKVLVQALAYARNGSGVGRTAIVNKIKAIIGTEPDGGTEQPLDMWRQIADWIAAADLVDLDDATFDAYVRTLPDLVVYGQANWNTLRKCARTSGNNWGAYARPSLLAVGLWLKKRGLTASNGQTGQSLIDEVTNYFKRWLGDTSIPNTYIATGSFSAGWSNVGYPASGGVINSGTPTSPGQLAGANSEDASRGSASPPLAANGTSYSLEAMDGALMTAILLHHAGKTDVWSWSNSALRRYAQHIGSANFTASNHIYHHEPALLNHVYALGLSIPTNDSYGGRQVPFATDWLAESGSQFLKTAITGDAGTGTGAVIAPTVAFSLSASAQTVTLTDTSTAGSSAITRREINWGDGSAVQTLTAPTATATHTYSLTTATTYTVRDTVFSADSSATLTHTIAVSAPGGAPTAVLSVTPNRGTAPLTVTYNFAGSTGTSPTYSIDFGDGTVVNPAAASGTYTYTDVTGNGASYSVTGRVTAGGLTSAPVVRTVTVDSAASSSVTGSLFIAIGGKLYPINANEVLHLAAGQSIPAGTRSGILVVQD